MKLQYSTNIVRQYFVQHIIDKTNIVAQEFSPYHLVRGSQLSGKSCVKTDFVIYTQICRSEQSATSAIAEVL